jgi:hypothetical protein
MRQHTPAYASTTPAERLLGCLEALNVGAQSPENLLLALLLALPHTHALMLLKRLLFSQIVWKR